MEEMTRESFWISHVGEKKKIKDLEDTHIVNLLFFTKNNLKKLKKTLKELEDSDDHTYYNILLKHQLIITEEKISCFKNIQKVIKEEIKIRKIEGMVKKGPYEYVAKGKRYKWNYDENKPKQIHNSEHFIKNIIDEQEEK